jgi:hypothetical protein
VKKRKVFKQNSELRSFLFPTLEESTFPTTIMETETILLMAIVSHKQNSPRFTHDMVHRVKLQQNGFSVVFEIKNFG